jgi:hypothetical protein
MQFVLGKIRKKNQTLCERRCGKFKDKLASVLLQDDSFTAKLLGLVNRYKRYLSQGGQTVRDKEL